MLRAKVAAAAVNTTAGDVPGNTQRIVAAINAAKAEGVRFLCLPELAITGYGCEDGFHSVSMTVLALEALDQIANATHHITVAVGLPLFIESKLYNAVAVITQGELKGFVLKQHLAGDGIHYEPRWFAPWPKGQVVEIELADTKVPAGDLVFDFDGIKLGFEICEDAWTAERPANDLALQGIDIIANPSASHFAFFKRDVRRRLVTSAAGTGMLAYLYANLLGDEAGRVIFDGHTMIASGGPLLAEGPRLSFKDFTLITAVVDIESNRRARMKTTSFKPRALAPVRVVESWFSLETEEKLTPSLKASKDSWEASEYQQCEEFLHATALGLFDYMRKSYSPGFVVSLSGGRDSALVALIAYEAMLLAELELGWDGLCERLSFIPAIREGKITNRKELMAHVLWTVYQPTRNSGEETNAAARELAGGMGATHMVLDVDWAFAGYEAGVNKALTRQLTWTEHNVTLQNMQARVRVPGLWAIANIDGRLLLCTSNRSEAGVGYCTMDGDTAGGLDPIGGVSKTFIIQYLDWYGNVGPTNGRGMGRASVRDSLSSVLGLKPTAELCPADQAQTDEGDLMPYPVLDTIERLAIQERLFPLETLHRLREEWGESYALEQLRDWVVKWFQLFSRNQWKRERLAVSFHLDDRNLDPKSWCRMPILCALYTAEVAKLRELVFDKAEAA